MSAVLLGLTFLIKNEARLDFGKEIISIGNNTKYINDQARENNENPDSKLVRKAFCIKDNILRNMEKLNKTLGTIPNEPMEIKVNSTQPFRRYPYKTPL